MTTSELLVGTFVLLCLLAISFWFGVFIGMHVAGKKRRKELLDQIKDLEDNEK